MFSGRLSLVLKLPALLNRELIIKNYFVSVAGTGLPVLNVSGTLAPAALTLM